MQTHSSITPNVEAIPIKKGLAVLSGYGLSIDVHHGRLQVRDGMGAARREACYGKATCGISRLVILGHSGVISLSALRWLYDAKAAIVQVDGDGNVIIASSPLNDRDNALRRAQVLARDGERGRRIVAKLLADKIDGEARVAALIGPGLGQRIASYAGYLRETETIEGIRVMESRAAAEYWKAWSEIPLKFARRDITKVPDYWQSFGVRESPLTHSPRNAANPANALLNYLYAILEAEARIALLTIGLDPGLGLMHADQPNRDSLACDLMEAVRPEVDEWLLAFLSNAAFAAKDFFERPDGSVRITRGIAQRLAETASLWRRAVSPVAEWVATELMRSPRRGLKVANRILEKRVPTRLTESNRSIGRAAYRGSKARAQRSPGILKSKTCPECGNAVAGASNRFCSKQCWQAYNRALVVPKLSKAGPKALALYRSKGADPGHGGAAARKRGKTNARRARERAEWEKFGVDLEAERERFKKDILPALQAVPLSRIIKATGLSRRYASMIRRGMCIPHPARYEALSQLIHGEGCQ